LLISQLDMVLSTNTGLQESFPKGYFTADVHRRSGECESMTRRRF
jgi:hypothetical protein